MNYKPDEQDPYIISHESYRLRVIDCNPPLEQYLNEQSYSTGSNGSPSVTSNGLCEQYRAPAAVQVP
jgi:hypothetical protein